MIRIARLIATATLTLPALTPAALAHDPIKAAPSAKTAPTFDIVRTEIRVQGDQLVFAHATTGTPGALIPDRNGKLAGAPVYSYVWPTSLDSGAVGFEPGQGILALAVTAHPDFDDTPLDDENGDGNPKNDGASWHSHWVVLVKDAACGAAGLKVKDIPKGAKPALPKTWPGLPLLLDSPGYRPAFGADTVEVRVPLKDVGAPRDFKYDGVTAGLRVNANVHDPLLCVENVFKVASGDLSLPGRLRR
jgi:hypothetical protein